MVGQLLPVLGVVLGALMSYAMSTLAERARHRRELRNRWDGRELDAYIEYIGTVVVMARIAGQVAGLRGFDPLAARIADEAKGLAALDDAEQKRTVAFERVVLLGDVATINCGYALNRAVWQLEWLARGAVNGSVGAWNAARAKYVSALGDFHVCARHDLAVVGTISPKRQIEAPEPPEAPQLPLPPAEMLEPGAPPGLPVIPGTSGASAQAATSTEG